MIALTARAIRCTSQAKTRRCPLNSVHGSTTNLPCGASICSGSCSRSHGASAGSCRKSMHTLSPAVKPLPRKTIAPPPEAVAIYYSTCSGKTEEVANIIKETLGDDANEPMDIGEVPDLATALTDSSVDGLIVGAPTWNTGADEGRSGTAWDDVLDKVKTMNLKGRKVAVFGCGDQVSYGDYYCDAMEELYSSFAAAGADMVGHWPTEGYKHTESKAEIKPGTFCGLALDEDNQNDQTAPRIKQWTVQVLEEMENKATA